MKPKSKFQEIGSKNRLDSIREKCVGPVSGQSWAARTKTGAKPNPWGWVQQAAEPEYLFVYFM